VFILRKEHLDAFALAAREGFEDRTAAHLQSRFPQECEELGEEEVRERIREGIERAGRYDIHAEKDVATFIRYMFGLAPDFDTSRKFEWVGPILRDKELSPTERLDKIKAVAREKREAEEA